MEFEGIPNGYFSEATEETQIDEEPLRKCNGGSESLPQPVIPASGCFDCNICLDFAVDPVVTLCGHLYCWPCIYKWLQIESVSIQQCPVCKASLSQDSLVPLYGRGHNRSGKQTHQSFDIPRRPSSSVRHREQSEIEEEEDNYPAIQRHRHHHYHVHQHEHHHHYGPSNEFVLSSPSSGTPSRVIHSTAGGVLGGMAIAVLPWVLRNHQEAASMSFVTPSPYTVGSNGASPSQRRQEMEVESSLHQIWVFLFCCTMLCLLLF